MVHRFLVFQGDNGPKGPERPILGCYALAVEPGFTDLRVIALQSEEALNEECILPGMSLRVPTTKDVA